jgi:hypothetical protein
MRHLLTLPLLLLATLSACSSAAKDRVSVVADLVGEYVYTLQSEAGDVRDVITLREDGRYVRELTMPMMEETSVDSGVVGADPEHNRLTLRSDLPVEEKTMHLLVQGETLRNEDQQRAFAITGVQGEAIVYEKQ